MGGLFWNPPKLGYRDVANKHLGAARNGFRQISFGIFPIVIYTG